MERLSQRDFRALLEFVRGLHARHDLDGLVDYVLDELPGLVRSEFAAYNEINPRRRRIVWLDRPSLASVLPEGRTIFQRHMGDHPLIRHYERSRDGSARMISDFLTLRQFRDLGLYQEFFARFDGGDHQLVIGLPTLPPLVAGISLNRDGADFTERDRTVMNLLRSHVMQAHRTAEGVTELGDTLALAHRGVDHLGRGLIVVAPDGRIRLLTDRARRWVSQYFGTGERSRQGSQLPESLRLWLRHQASGLTRRDDAPRAPDPLVRNGPGRRLVIRLVLESEGYLLLLEEEVMAVRADSLQACSLTPREAEVLAWVAEGKTNVEIAAILGARRRTVSKHLERIFQKLGVETRTAAARRALELQQVPVAVS